MPPWPAGTTAFRRPAPTRSAWSAKFPAPIAPAPAERSTCLRCTKRFAFALGSTRYRLHCTTRLSCANTQARPALVGIEIVLNFLAPRRAKPLLRNPLGAPSAELGRGRCRQRNRFTVKTSVDEWQNVAATIEAPRPRRIWIAPIETISESEEGFERVYQGSQILAVWPLELLAAKPWTGEISLAVEAARKTAPDSLR